MTPSGDRISLKGQSNTVDSVANFLAYLKNSGSFDAITLEQFYQDDIKEHLTYKFQLSCLFKQPTGAATPTGGAAPGGPSAGPAPGPQGLAGQVQTQTQGLRQVR